MNLFYQPQIPDGVLHLDEEESRHCVKVLRKNAGDLIHITDGKGSFYHAVIVLADLRKCTFTIQKTTLTKARKFRLHIAVSPTKNADRIEWFVEKATEFGIDEITLMECANTERSFIKTERLKKIAISAMKQSLKANLPIINELLPFSSIISRDDGSRKFIAHVDNDNPVSLQRSVVKNESSLILIGPEGDFSPAEIEAAIGRGFIKVSLGPSRLRTETAALAACHVVNLVNE